MCMECSYRAPLLLQHQNFLFDLKTDIGLACYSFFPYSNHLALGLGLDFFQHVVGEIFGEPHSVLAWKSQSFLILCIVLLLLAGVAFDFHMAERDTEGLHRVYSAGASLFQRSYCCERTKSP